MIENDVLSMDGIVLFLGKFKHFLLLFSFIILFFNFFLKILFIYLTDRDHKQAERQAEREGEAGSQLSREPDAGLDPRTLTW